MPHTLAQKILQAHTDEEVREAGQIVNCHLSGVLANDITGPLAIKSFRAMGAAKVFDKDRVFLVMDHFTPQKDIDSANQVMVTRKFAQEMDVTHYYEGGDCGVEHVCRRSFRAADRYILWFRKSACAIIWPVWRLLYYGRSFRSWGNDRKCRIRKKCPCHGIQPLCNSREGIPFSSCLWKPAA